MAEPAEAWLGRVPGELTVHRVDGVEAEVQTWAAVRRLVEDTYRALSTPGSDFAVYFGAEDMAVAGSGESELFSGPDRVLEVAGQVARLGHHWAAEDVRVWCRGDVAWAQILGHYEVAQGDRVERIPYRTTGVFERLDEHWRWVYWGGSQPIPSASSPSPGLPESAGSSRDEVLRGGRSRRQS